jgi:hypothetical protein
MGKAGCLPRPRREPEDFEKEKNASEASMSLKTQEAHCKTNPKTNPRETQF